MCKWSKLKKPILTTLGVLGVAYAGAAQAQVAANPHYYLKGSDTWFEVMTDAVAGAKAAGVIPTTSPSLSYDGTGSGNASSSMASTTSGGGAAPYLGTQSIGPMSRNFRPSEITRFPTWAPTVSNVGGLDAAVLVRNDSSATCGNADLPLLPADPTKAKPNDTTLVNIFQTPGSGYDQMLEVILSGFDGSGSTAACADPRRIQVVLDFAACNNVPNVRHFYRRDDNSGTTDTFKDKVAVQRFCNGAAVGVLTARADGKFNLNNQDYDPIRRPCDTATAARKQTTCTDLTTGLICNTTAANCTQGLVVALSEGDPATTDVTRSIAERVKADATGQIFGYAGREAVRLAAGGTQAVFINTNPPEDDLVRADNYMLSRRLFLMRAPAIPSRDATAFVSGQPAPTFDSTNGVRLCNGVATPSGGCNERALDNASTTQKCPSSSTNNCTGGGTAQRDMEDALFTWMTQLGPDKRCNLDPIMRNWGFLPCLDDCLVNPTGAENLCSKTPYAPVPSTPSACIPSAATPLAGTGLWTGAAVACTTGQICCSTGAACPGTLTCPAATGRPVNSACWPSAQQGSCAAGLTCTDIGAGTRVCQ
jgi:hypothetical protein